MGNGSVNTDDVQVASPAPACSVLPGSKYMAKEGTRLFFFFCPPSYLFHRQGAEVGIKEKKTSAAY